MLSGSQGPAGRVWRTEIPFPQPGVELWIVQPIASHWTHYTIPALKIEACEGSCTAYRLVCIWVRAVFRVFAVLLYIYPYLPKYKSLEGSGFKPQCGQDFLHLSRPALWPTQPTIPWAPGVYWQKIDWGMASSTHTNLQMRLKKE